ncbi:MAG: tryptophan synthase subunit alpha [Phycisphaerae bacterium]
MTPALHDMISDTFEQLRRQKEMALIPYLTAGFPALDESIELIAGMADNGADIVEVGVPFGDPVADGPTIQHASEVALAQGARLIDILHALRAANIPKPVVLMSYLNPLMAYPQGRLFKDMKDAGVSGLIVPDLPPEEAQGWLAEARANGVNLILLVAPTSSDERVRQISDCCDTFLYYVTVTGITGARRSLPEDLTDSLQRVRRIAQKPVVAGFGISDARQVRALRGHAHGVVVGSRIVEAVRQGEDLTELIKNLKQATRS